MLSFLFLKRLFQSFICLVIFHCLWILYSYVQIPSFISSTYWACLFCVVYLLISSLRLLRIQVSSFLFVCWISHIVANFCLCLFSLRVVAGCMLFLSIFKIESLCVCVCVWTEGILISSYLFEPYLWEFFKAWSRELSSRYDFYLLLPAP